GHARHRAGHDHRDRSGATKRQQRPGLAAIALDVFCTVEDASITTLGAPLELFSCTIHIRQDSEAVGSARLPLAPQVPQMHS
ncbi:MAG: hypothetical protein ACJA2F_001355, partial [Nitriliruptoraceae bacterium]